MAELYAKPYEIIDTGYNPQQPQQSGQDAEMQAYLSSLPPEERQRAIERINAPLTGEELSMMASSGQKIPTLEEFAEIEKYHKTQEVSFIDGLGKIAEGGEQVVNDLTNAFSSFVDAPLDATKKLPATAVEAFAQGTRNFYGMLAQSQNPDSVLFGVKDFLTGGGTIEDRYQQYLKALKFNKHSADLAEGRDTLVMDKDVINPEITQAMAYIADPTLFVPFGKVASTGLRAVGLGEKLTMAGAKAAAIKNGIIGGTLKWGVGQPLEFLGGAVRNTIDYGVEKAGAAFEATTGISGKEFAQTARMSGIGFSASGIAGHAVPYASTISDAYIVGSSARGFGEAITLLGETMSKNKFGRGINSWAAESLDQARKNGVALSPHAKGLLNTLNAVDPLFAYGWNGLETAAEGAVIGGTLGYLGGGEEGMYSGIGAGIALGSVGGTAGKAFADVTGGTNVARRAVQAKMVIEGLKETNPERAMFFQAMQKATEVKGKDVDLVNGIIAGIDNVAPNFEFHALTPDQFIVEAAKKGYDPATGKFREMSAIDVEFGSDRASKSRAMYVLRSIGGEFVGDRAAFLDALKKASAKDSANPNKPASNIPANLRKYIDVAKTFEKLTKTQQEAILKEIDGQGAKASELGGKQKLRDFYDALTWSEAWTDSLVKKFEADREGARKDIVDMLAQETNKKGELTSKGRALADKLRAEGFLDKNNKLLRERNLLKADMTASEFAFSKGAVISRESDGKTHMYINLNSMGDETFPHELFHTIMRESPMKKHFTDNIVQKLLGSYDKDGKLVRPSEVNLSQVSKFFKKYIELTNRNDDGTLNSQAADALFKNVEEALSEYQKAGDNKKISDKARGLLEHYTEEFGAYYFSHWLMGRNRNTLFFGGELKGIEGIVERAKDSFKDFWQSKISKANPEFDFSNGLNEAFDRSKGLGRISSIDYFMRDMVRAASNANKDFFRPDAMTMDNLRDFERSNGLRNLTAVNGNRRLNPREQVTQNIRLGKEAYKILSGLDKNLRTSKDVLDENGKQVITGRFSEAELDALVKGGIVPRAWADKVNQGYAMLDGTISNVFSAGYLGKTEQTTDASYPRLTGKDVAFKNRKAVLFDVETKVKADGTFYTLFHTLDLAVIEQRANQLWQNSDYKNLWNGDRSAMEADFFKYISNASKAGTDTTKLDSAKLLENGDGNGAKRRDVLQQMAGMALQTGDAYKHQPIAVIPEGIRHSVTTFNIDGMTMPRVETGARYDINMGNAHKFIRENWQPAEMVQEKTPNGVLMTHESGFKFAVNNGKTTAYTSAGRKIGTFESTKQAAEAAKREYHKVYDNLEAAVAKDIQEQNKIATKFQPLDENERLEARRLGDVFLLPSMRRFVGDRTLLRQTREEHIFQRALEAIENPEQLLAYSQTVFKDHLNIRAEYDRLIADITEKENQFEGEKTIWASSYYRKLNQLRDVKYGYPSSFEDWQFDQRNQGNWNPPERIISNGIGMGDLNTEYSKYIREGFSRYEADAKAAWAKLTADPEYIESQKDYNQKTTYFVQRANELIQIRDGIEEFKKQNKEALESPVVEKLTDVLGNYKDEEKAGIFAKLVEASVNQKDYSGLLEALFAQEYDSQIQTGKPFVAVTTHGTGSVELMLSRLFASDKLGSHYDIPSSRMGSFSAGSQNTSKAYAQTPRQPSSSFRDKIVTLLNEGDDAAKKLVNDYDKDVTYALMKRWAEKRAKYEDYIRNQNYDKKLSKNPREWSEEYTTLVLEGFGQDKFDVYKAQQIESLQKEQVFSSAVDIIDELQAKYPWMTPEIASKYDRIKEQYKNFVKVYPQKKMQLRKVIRMDNPYVVVDPRSYEEHYISPHMKRAMEAGHDGIVFKRFADGGERDNVYVVFKDFMKDNIKVIDTSFDGEGVPRGSDETGRVLKGGRELKLGFQPTEGAEGGRVYDQNSNEFKFNFIGKQAEENQDLIQGKNLEFVKRKDGSYRITLTDNGEGYDTRKIGHITATIDDASVVAGEGAAEISSNIDPKYRGQKLANILYSEMAERLRSMGIKYVDGTIVNKDGIPVQVRNTVIGQTYYQGKNTPAFREDTAKKVQALQSIGLRQGVGVYNILDPQARYQPTEREVPTRDQGFNRVYREISRSKKASLNSIKQSYLDKWGIDVRDFERFQQLTDAHYKLQQEMADGKYQGTEREYYDDIQELKNDIKDLVDSFDSSITTTQGDYAHQFTDQLDEIERGISRIKSVVETISEQPLSKVDSWSGKNRLEAVLKRELGSGFAQDISGDDIKIADAVREFAGQRYEQTALGEAFESELYSSDYITPQKGRHHYTIPASEGANKKGILVDILRSENKLTDKGLPQGEVNPRRIINSLRNKSGGDSKVYAEAKAIGLIDWLESKQEGKNQKKVTTKELIEFVENNKMGLTIDPQLEQAADFGNTRPYVTGGETQAEKGYRVYVVRMKNANHEHGVEGHFEGAVVHIRATLRDTKDGRKVMHIEEIQANNTATNELSPRQKEIVLKEIQILERLKKETDVLDEDHRRALSNARSHSYVGDEENTALEYKKLAIETIDKVNYEKKDKHRRKYAEQLYDLNPEFWQDKFANNNARTREKYIELTDRWLLSHNIDMFVSEKKTAANSSRNNAPLQDPKEWVKVAFRTVLRKALVEGVDRITITPWSETPIQVGMKAKSAERFYGKTIADAFNSELAKMNSRLNVENKNVSARQQRITEANIKLNESIQAVAKAVDVNAPNGGADIKKMFEYLHMSDEDLKAKMEKTEHEPYGQPYYGARPAYMKWAEFELQKLPLDYKGRDELYAATQRRANKLGAFIGEELASAGEKTPSGLPYAASEAHMSESQYLVDRSMGFDMTPEIRKKAARPQRMMQPSEGFSNFQTERTPTGVLLKNAAGYVISRIGSKYRVYNPYKAVIGVYDNEEQAKRRVQREEPKR